MKLKLNYQEIGLKIRKHRIMMDMTQQELADKVELSVSHLSNIETNKTKVSLESLFNIAQNLNCTMDEMLREDDLADQALANSLFYDCDEYEREIIFEVVKGLKQTLKKHSVIGIDIQGKK